MARQKDPTIERRAVEVFQAHGGILRSSDAIKFGIHPRTLYRLKGEGKIEQLERGLFCLPNLPGHANPDLVTVAKKVPSGVICLISALYFHGLTTQIPHFVYLAVKQGYKPPKITYPPVTFFWFTASIHEDGIESYELDGVQVKCYSKEKTLVDCFRYRHKIGIDVAIEALKKYWLQGHPKLDMILKHAKIGRMEKVIKPYIETVINESS